MSGSQQFSFDSNLNKLKHEILERESELNAAKRNAVEAQKELLEITKDFTKLRENLLKLPEPKKSGPLYELLQSFRNDLNKKITQATLKSSQAIKKASVAFEALKASQETLQKYEFQQRESHTSKARKKAQYPDPEEYEKQMFQNILHAAEKGTNFMKNADQEKFHLHQNEKDYEVFAKAIDKFIHIESFKKDPMLREAVSNLQKLRDTIDKEAEDYLEIKENGLKAYTAALKLKEHLSPEYRKLILKDLQNLMPSTKKMNQIQMTPMKQNISAQVAPEKSFVSVPSAAVQKSQVQVAPSFQSKIKSFVKGCDSNACFHGILLFYF